MFKKKEEKENAVLADIKKFAQMREDSGNFAVEETIEYTWNTAQNEVRRRNAPIVLLVVGFLLILSFMTFNRLGLSSEISSINQHITAVCEAK